MSKSPRILSFVNDCKQKQIFFEKKEGVTNLHEQHSRLHQLFKLATYNENVYTVLYVHGPAATIHTTQTLLHVEWPPTLGMALDTLPTYGVLYCLYTCTYMECSIPMSRHPHADGRIAHDARRVASLDGKVGAEGKAKQKAQVKLIILLIHVAILFLPRSA